MKHILYAVLCLCLLSGCVPVPKDIFAPSSETIKDRQVQTRRFETTDKVAMLKAATAVLQDLGFGIDEVEYNLGVLVASKMRDATSGSQIAGMIAVALLGGGSVPIDSYQTIRVSLVMRGVETDKQKKVVKKPQLTSNEIDDIREFVVSKLARALVKEYPADITKKVARQVAENTTKTLITDLERIIAINASVGDSVVRTTFQRVIIDTQGRITRAEQIVDEDIYKTFYEKLSKAIFLEAHEL